MYIICYYLGFVYFTLKKNKGKTLLAVLSLSLPLFSCNDVKIVAISQQNGSPSYEDSSGFSQTSKIGTFQALWQFSLENSLKSV